MVVFRTTYDRQSTVSPFTPLLISTEYRLAPPLHCDYKQIYIEIMCPDRPRRGGRDVLFYSWRPKRPIHK